MYLRRIIKEIDDLIVPTGRGKIEIWIYIDKFLLSIVDFYNNNKKRDCILKYIIRQFWILTFKYNIIEIGNCVRY